MTQIIAIYARYSTDNQNDRSIEDQFDVCKDYMIKNSIKGQVQAFSDRAISGSRMENRPELKKMMKLVEDGKISVIISESMSRLSRDIGDLSYIHKISQYKNVTITTAQEGILNKMLIGLTGTMSSMLIDQIIAHIRRGQAGNIKLGKSAGSLPYGYSVRQRNDQGKLEAGLREINAVEANIVRRIYNEFANGTSIWAIRNKLNEEGVPAPRGGKWNTVTLSGHNGRGNGILQNTIYKGLLIWNRVPANKHPITGVRHIVINKQSEWVSKYDQSYQIVDTKTWEKVHDMLAKRWRRNKSKKPFNHFPVDFSCGHCGKPMIRNDVRRFVCYQAKRFGTCSESKKVSHNRLKIAVMDILTETSKAVFNTWIVDLKQMKKVAEKKHVKLRNKISRKQKDLEKPYS